MLQRITHGHFTYYKELNCKKSFDFVKNIGWKTLRYLVSVYWSITYFPNLNFLLDERVQSTLQGSFILCHNLFLHSLYLAFHFVCQHISYFKYISKTLINALLQMDRNLTSSWCTTTQLLLIRCQKMKNIQNLKYHGLLYY